MRTALRGSLRATYGESLHGSSLGLSLAQVASMLDFQSPASSFFSEPFDWVTALEQRQFAVGERRVSFEVQGFVDNGEHYWIQVASVTNPMLTILLHVFPGASLRDLIRTLLAVDARAPWPTALDIQKPDPA